MMYYCYRGDLCSSANVRSATHWGRRRKKGKMEARRGGGSRGIVDPKVRHVGFMAPLLPAPHNLSPSTHNAPDSGPFSAASPQRRDYMSIPSDNLSEPSFSHMQQLSSAMDAMYLKHDDLPENLSPAIAGVSLLPKSIEFSSFELETGPSLSVQPISTRISGRGKTLGGDVMQGNIHKQNKSSKDQPSRKGNASEKVSSAGEKRREKGPEKEKKREAPAPRMQFDDGHRVTKAKKRALIEQMEPSQRVELFKHLPQFVPASQLQCLEAKFFQDGLMHTHPAIYQVGLQYLTGEIAGGNARCIAMLLAFQNLIKDYNTPIDKTLPRDLMAKINSHVSFLTTCRPLSISMGNAIRFLKVRIAKLPVSQPEAEAKVYLITEIDRFIQEKIIFVDQEITKHAVTKIRDGDVILTYASSCIVKMLLFHAIELGKSFRVIIVDSRPHLKGKRLLRQMLDKGVNCTYIHINAVSYIMQEVTRVFLGAASVLSNGTVYSRIGTACVAMVAHAFHIPVLICCETYKFHERVQLDSICSNELGDPDALIKVPGREELHRLEGLTANKNLQLLNLTYDLTPPEYVSVIITELGLVPPTSVPVILREHRVEPLL